jgi:cell division protein FtsB
MEQRTNPFRSIRIIPRPGPRKLKIIIAALLLACSVALIALGVVHSRIQQKSRDALDQAAALEQDNADLADKTENLGSSSVIKEIARDELGLVDPGTILIDPNS